MSEAVVIAIVVLLLQEPVKDIYSLTKKVVRTNKTKISKFFSFLWSFVLPIAIILYYLKYEEFGKGFVIVVVGGGCFLMLNIFLKFLKQVRERLHFEALYSRDDTIERLKGNIELYKGDIALQNTLAELIKITTYLVEQQIETNRERVGVTEEEKSQLEGKKEELEATLDQLKEIEKNRPNIIRKISPDIN